MKKTIFGSRKSYTGTLLTGLFAYYRFDNDFNDSSGNNLNGTVTGTGYNYVPAKINNGISFSTTDFAGRIPHNSMFNFSDATNDYPFSIAFNVKINISKSSGYHCIVDKILGSLCWLVRFYQDKLEVMLFGTGGGQIYKRMQVAVPINQFLNFCVTYDGSKQSAGLKIYMNSSETLVNDLSTGNFTKLKQNTTRLVIGQFGDSELGGGSLIGIIDDLCFWNRKLTESEITENYNRTINLI